MKFLQCWNMMYTMQNMLILLSLLLSHVVTLTTYKTKRAECFFDSECQDTFICSDGKCVEASTEQHVIAKQTCPNFKDKCKSDSECACATDSMICEDSECVYSSNHNQQVATTCKEHTDCRIPYLCENGSCREATTLDELAILLTALKKCTVDSDCPSDHKCHTTTSKCVAANVNINSKLFKRGNACVINSDCSTGFICKNQFCRKDMEAVHLAFCIINSYRSICLDDTDCPKCCSIKFTCTQHKCT